MCCFALMESDWLLGVGFLFEFDNDGVEPSKLYSFISLLVILKCLSKTLVMFVVAVFFNHTCFRHYGHDCVNEAIQCHTHLERFTYPKLNKHRLEDHWIQSLFITLKRKCDSSFCNTHKYTSHKGIVPASFLFLGRLLIFWRRESTTWTSSTFWALVWSIAGTDVDDPPWYLGSANIVQGRFRFGVRAFNRPK